MYAGQAPSRHKPRPNRRNPNRSTPDTVHRFHVRPKHPQIFFPFMALDAQLRFCAEERIAPRVPPGGICPTCGKNIFARVVHLAPDEDGALVPVSTTGISVQQAESQPIIQCPHCGEPV